MSYILNDIETIAFVVFILLIAALSIQLFFDLEQNGHFVDFKNDVAEYFELDTTIKGRKVLKSLLFWVTDHNHFTTIDNCLQNNRTAKQLKQMGFTHVEQKENSTLFDLNIYIKNKRSEYLEINSFKILLSINLFCKKIVV